MALYTMCFLGGAEENVVWLDDFQVKVKAYRIRSNKGGDISMAGFGCAQCNVMLPHPPPADAWTRVAHC